MLWLFTITIKDLDEFTDAQADALYEAGCSDGTLCSSDGRAYIHFDRESESLHKAIRSAIADIEAAGLEIDHIEIDRDELAEWPVEQRLSLARSVMATVNEPPPKLATADEVIAEIRARYPGLFAQSDTRKLRSLIGNALGNRQPPNDAEVKQWIDEHRMEKYGS